MNRAGGKRIRDINPDYFTGRVSLCDLTGGLGAKRCKIYHVSFFGGARTKVHKHTGAQLLMATGGTGSMVTFKKTGRGTARFGIIKDSTIRLGGGGIAYIPPGVLHAHGSAGAGGTFSHVAVNFEPAGGGEPKTAWYESDFKKSVTGIL